MPALPSQPVWCFLPALPFTRLQDTPDSVFLQASDVVLVRHASKEDPEAEAAMKPLPLPEAATRFVGKVRAHSAEEGTTFRIGNAARRLQPCAAYRICLNK